MENDYSFFVGIDWATEAHEVSVIDQSRKKIGGRAFENSAAGLDELCNWIERQFGPGRESIGVAIEVPRGALVETLVERGFHVYSINPKQLDRFRDRHTPAGAKDDRLDAFVLADSLRTDLPCFRRVQFDDPLMVELRELSRFDAQLSESKNRLTNQLREQLMRYAPQLLTLSPAADETWFWDLLDLAAKPEQAAKIKPYRIEKILSSNRIRRITSEKVLEVLRMPQLTVAPGTVEAATLHARLVIEQLRVISKQRIEVRKRIENTISQLSEPDNADKEREHRDAAILCSLPGVGKIVAATVLSEGAQAIASRDYAAFRAHAGIAPVTKRSGKKLSVIMRQACNERLRNALYHWTRVSVQRDPVSKSKYQSLRSRGHSHGRAIRSVADGILRIFFGMLKSGTLFDPAKCDPLTA